MCEFMSRARNDLSLSWRVSVCGCVRCQHVTVCLDVCVSVMYMPVCHCIYVTLAVCNGLGMTCICLFECIYEIVSLKLVSVCAPV